MTILAVLLWAVLGYAAWRALRAGWDAWLESFTGITGLRSPGRTGLIPSDPPPPARPGQP